MATYTLGFSPCPNDTFIFDALVNGKIDTEGFGEKRHVAPNETSRGRGTNRRAVVQLAKL